MFDVSGPAMLPRRVGALVLNVWVCLVCLQFTVLLKAKAAKAVAPAKAHAKAKVTSGPAMSAKQAMEIVSMRKAVDERLNNTSHTCLDGECGGK